MVENWNPASAGGVFMDSSFVLHYQEGASHTDGIPDSLNEVIHPFWSTFPPQHPLIAYAVALLMFVIWVISVFGNGIVIYIFLKVSTLRTPTNMFVVNLAFSDLCMITTMGVPVFMNLFFERYWAYGVLACKLYGCLGAIFGTCSIMTMVVIGYDRYNVIVKGFKGVKITKGKAAIMLLSLWVYVTLICTPPFFGWGGYAAEGMLLTCGYDSLGEDWNRKSFLLYAFIGNYLFPLFLIILYYSQIVRAVVSHEKALKEQAKKMNVESLRSNEKDGESAEIKIAKVAITNVMLWFSIWTPYAAVTMTGGFISKDLISPVISQLPAVLAKIGSSLNPIVFAVSHPKFREALATELPGLGIGEKPADKETGAVSSTTKC